MSTAVADVLRDARLLITPPDAFTRHFYARDRHGNQTKPRAKNAVCWCAIGSLHAITKSQPLLRRARKALARASGNESTPIVIISDSSTHNSVLRLFDRAEAAERAAP